MWYIIPDLIGSCEGLPGRGIIGALHQQVHACVSARGLAAVEVDGYIVMDREWRGGILLAEFVRPL
jgi:hypothetical protein